MSSSYDQGQLQKTTTSQREVLEIVWVRRGVPCNLLITIMFFKLFWIWGRETFSCNKKFYNYLEIIFDNTVKFFSNPQ